MGRGGDGEDGDQGADGVGKVALAVLIWVGIFSPVILVIGVAVILIRRYGSRLRSVMPGGPSPSGSNPGGETE